MINQARQITATAVRAVTQEYDSDWPRKAHSTLMAIIATLFITLVAMWVLNITGAKGVNGFFFWGGVFFLVGKSLLPSVIGTVGFLGFFFAWLNDSDKSRGILKGLSVWAQIVEGMIFVWMSAAFVLWTFSYEDAPLGNFWLHLAGASLLTLVARKMGFGGKTGTFILGCYIVAVLGMNLWNDHIPANLKGDSDSESTKPLTAKEQKDRLAREIQEAELARVRAVASEATRQATERARAESVTDAKAGTCLRRYTEQKNCVTVVFGHNTKYDREGIAGHCIVSDPVSALTRTDLGGGQYRYVGKAGLTAQFFDLPVGQSIGTFKCGG
ncbi:MAG: hypothetical protein R3B53_02760 [Candidatus Paceibacterota bacterium]